MAAQSKSGEDGPPRPIGKALPLASLYSSSSRSTGSAVTPAPLLLAMSSVPAWSSRQSCGSSALQDLGLGVINKEESVFPSTTRITVSTERERDEPTPKRPEKLHRISSSRVASSESRGTSILREDDEYSIPRPLRELNGQQSEFDEEEFSGRGVSDRQAPSVVHVHYHLSNGGPSSPAGSVVSRRSRASSATAASIKRRVFDVLPTTEPTRYSWQECLRVNYWREVLCCAHEEDRAFSTKD